MLTANRGTRSFVFSADQPSLVWIFTLNFSVVNTRTLASRTQITLVNEKLDD